MRQIANAARDERAVCEAERASVERGTGATGSPWSEAKCALVTAESQLPLLVDQIKAFENRIGLGRTTAAQIGKALEDYEMLTEQELALWIKNLK